MLSCTCLLSLKVEVLMSYLEMVLHHLVVVCTRPVAHEDETGMRSIFQTMLPCACDKAGCVMTSLVASVHYAVDFLHSQYMTTRARGYQNKDAGTDTCTGKSKNASTVPFVLGV
jgi:hypothetical protein